MRGKLVLAFCCYPPLPAVAQDKMAEQLRKGIV